jgi:uncharacterized protein YbjT (DUF2867 family)
MSDSATSGPNVVVTSANSRTGRDVLADLAGTGAHVTALVRTEADLPAAEVVTDWLTSPRTAEVLAEADVVVHLSGVFAAPTWEAYAEGTVGTTRRLIDALGSATPRIVYVSYVGADAASDNWYVRSKGEAEDLLAGRNAVIFRVHPIVRGAGDPAPFERMLQAAPGTAVKIFGDGSQRFSPVYAADVVAAVAAAVAGSGEPGTYDLVGPDHLPMTELAQLVNGRTPELELVPVEVALKVPALLPTIVDIFAKPTVPGSTAEVTRLFGVSPTPLKAIWPITG